MKNHTNDTLVIHVFAVDRVVSDKRDHDRALLEQALFPQDEGGLFWAAVYRARGRVGVPAVHDASRFPVGGRPLYACADGGLLHAVRDHRAQPPEPSHPPDAHEEPHFGDCYAERGELHRTGSRNPDFSSSSNEMWGE